MYTRVKAFIERIRHREEHIRRRWLIALSTGSMVIVVGLWMSYMSATIDGPIEKEVGSRPTLSAVFSVGLSVLKDKGIAVGSYIKNKITGGHQIIIENPRKDSADVILQPTDERSFPESN